MSETMLKLRQGHQRPTNAERPTLQARNGQTFRIQQLRLGNNVSFFCYDKRKYVLWSDNTFDIGEDLRKLTVRKFTDNTLSREPLKPLKI